MLLSNPLSKTSDFKKMFEQIALNETVLRGLKPTATGRRIIADTKCPGLHIRVQVRGKVWFVRYQIVGRRREANIGGYPDLDLTQARQKATAILSAAKSGTDFLANAKAKADRDRKLSDVLEEYYKSHLQGKSKSWRETKRLHDLYTLPAWGRMRIGQITYQHLYKERERIRQEKPVQSNRLVAAWKALFRWAHEDRRIILENPCVGLKKAEHEKARDRFLTVEEAAKIWIASEKLSTPSRQAIRLLLLTGARRDEIRCLEWTEIDLENCLWTLPATRNKTKTVRQTPLGPIAIETLHSVPAPYTAGPVLTGRSNLKPIQNLQKAKQLIDKALPNLEHWTLHDLRRTVATQMAFLKFSGETIARVLGHSERALMGVTAVYERADHNAEKRIALETWEATLMKSVQENRKTHNV